MCALSTETNATVLTQRLARFFGCNRDFNVSAALEANVFAVLVNQRILNTEVSIAEVWAVNVNVCLFRSVCA